MIKLSIRHIIKELKIKIVVGAIVCPRCGNKEAKKDFGLVDCPNIECSNYYVPKVYESKPTEKPKEVSKEEQYENNLKLMLAGYTLGAPTGGFKVGDIVMRKQVGGKLTTEQRKLLITYVGIWSEDNNGKKMPAVLGRNIAHSDSGEPGYPYLLKELEPLK
jgi:hypothetical protein